MGKSLVAVFVAMLTWAPSHAYTILPVTGAGTLTSPKTLNADFFGIHFHRLWRKPNENAVRTVWPPLNFGMLRLWDSGTNWADIEPSQERWNFGRFDFYVNEAAARNVKVLYTLGSTPRWASLRPDEPCSYGYGCSAEPVEMEYWRKYVQTVARRYRGRICCYEVWNEPNFSGPPADQKQHGGFYTGTVENMVAMAKIARDVLREEDPNAILLSPAIVNGPYNRLDKFLAAGGKNYIQGVAYHFYAWNDEGRLLREIELVRKVMRENGISHMQLWSTEAGVEVVPTNHPLPSGIKKYISREEAAAMMVRQIILTASAGVEKYFYYAWDNDRSGMVDRAGNYQPSRDAMLLLQRWLLEANLGKCDVASDGLTVCWGEKSGETFFIVWNRASVDPTQVLLPSGYQIINSQVAVPRWYDSGSVESNSNTIWVTQNPTRYQFKKTNAP